MKYKKWEFSQKLEILSKSKEFGIVETFRKHGVSTGTFYSWKKKFEHKGEAGLKVNYKTKSKGLKKAKETLHLYFEEKITTPKEFTNQIIIAHGFHQQITVQDFPIRGNTVYLHIKRRRWLDKNDGQILQRDWNLVAKGTRMTNEFATFLKEINRY